MQLLSMLSMLASSSLKVKNKQGWRGACSAAEQHRCDELFFTESGQEALPDARSRQILKHLQNVAYLANQRDV